MAAGAASAVAFIVVTTVAPARRAVSVNSHTTRRQTARSRPLDSVRRGPSLACVACLRSPPRRPARPSAGAGARAPLRTATLVALAAYFVVVWGAGFVATRIALQYAAPFTYIGVRYAIAFVVALLAFGLRARWPTTPRRSGATSPSPACSATPATSAAATTRSAGACRPA